MHWHNLVEFISPAGILHLFPDRCGVCALLTQITDPHQLVPFRDHADHSGADLHRATKRLFLIAPARNDTQCIPGSFE